jgi:hypothetical protein
VRIVVRGRLFLIFPVEYKLKAITIFLECHIAKVAINSLY